jgi:hypothetical protein
MCFSATANFVGSGVLGAIGVVTLTKVKHRRELLFASLPALFAVHQFMEGFVWLGLDGMVSQKVMHAMAAAFMLFAQGLLPFLMPLSVYLVEADAAVRGAGSGDNGVYALGIGGVSDAGVCAEQQHCVCQRRYE